MTLLQFSCAGPQVYKRGVQHSIIWIAGAAPGPCGDIPH